MMINASEFRPGNLVYLPVPNLPYYLAAPTILIVTCVNICGAESTIKTEGSERVYTSAELQPIMLHNDPLEIFKPFETTFIRLNCHETERRRVYKVNETDRLQICFVSEDYGGNGRSYYRIRLNDDNVSMFLMCKLNWVHQLQNIVYWLTGKELQDISEK